MLARRLALATLVLILAACASPPVADVAPTPAATAPAPHMATRGTLGRAFREGVVAVSHPLAADAGARILEEGGNAVDAAVAIQFALNVVEPQWSGLGGGGFMMIRLARSGDTFLIDSRERAPAAAAPAMFVFTDVPPERRFDVASTSGVSVGVPGTPMGTELALRRFGTMPLARTLAPAIELAERGFPVGRSLAESIRDDEGRTSAWPETAAIFRPGGRPLAEGDRLVQPDLARTLRRFAAEGSAPFYRGDIADAIVLAQRRSRTPVSAEGLGRMTRDDLATYDVAIRAPLRGRYRGFDVVTAPPPSSGGLALLQMLGMLERFPLGDDTKGFGFGAPATMHVMIEAMRLAFADRAVWMGDSDAVPMPVSGLVDPRYLAARSAMIAPDARLPNASAGDPRAYERAAPTRERVAIAGAVDEPGGHTTHFVVVDRDGNLVSYTTTIENTWGSGITVPGFGFLLNNELTDFNLVPRARADPAAFDPGANDVAPRKRPRSSMAPTLLLRDGEPVASYGSPGGPTIINSLLNMTVNLVDHGMLVQQAIDAPRISVVSPEGRVSCEGGRVFMQPPIDVDTQDALRKLGHVLPGASASDACTASIGSIQAVVFDRAGGRVYGGADRRREGTVIGLPRAAR